MSAPAPRALAVGRIEGLDGWRAGLMVGGILLHASSWLESRPLFELVTLLSHTFRMGAFFAISGFLSARSLAGQAPGRWLARRLVQIGVPMTFGLAVLCPLITATVTAMPGAAQPAPVFNWYHLWFLVALLLYAPLAVAADWVDRTHGWGKLVAQWSGRSGISASLLAGTGMVSLLALLLLSLIIGGVGTAETMPVLVGWRSIASYWPDFLFGFVVSRSVAVQAAMLRDWRSPALILAGLALAYGAWFGLLAPAVSAGLRLWIDGMLPLIGQAAAPPAVFVFILRSSARVKRLGPAMRLMADGSFTIYLAHLPVIAVLTLATSAVPLAAEARYGAIILATLALTLAFHHLAVHRSAWLSLLFCGRPLARTKAASASAR